MRAVALASCLILSASVAGYSLTPRVVAGPRAAPTRPAFRTALPSTTSLPAMPAAPKRVAQIFMTEEMVVKETTQRSLVKAIGWRFTAGVVTAMTSYFFTGSLAMAASIVGWDLCSKSVTMFLGERLWNNVKWGKDGSGDSQKRSIAKALAWRAFAATNTLFASIVLTKGKAGVAGKIAGTDSVIKTILFYFYERVWAVVPWGKYMPEPEAIAAPEPAVAAE